MATAKPVDLRNSGLAVSDKKLEAAAVTDAPILCDARNKLQIFSFDVSVPSLSTQQLVDRNEVLHCAVLIVIPVLAFPTVACNACLPNNQEPTFSQLLDPFQEKLMKKSLSVPATSPTQQLSPPPAVQQICHLKVNCVSNSANICCP